jgi:hypothetical protein
MGRYKKGPGTTFPENWKEIMLNAGREGKTNVEFFPMLKIKHSTHFTLLRRNDEYKEVYEQYLLLHEQHWLDKAKAAIEQGQDFNTSMFILMMGNKQRKRWKRRNGNGE